MWIARQRADQIKASTIEHEFGSTTFDPNTIGISWRKMAIDAQAEFCERMGEREWEKEYRNVISIFGLNLRGISQRLGKPGKEAQTHNDEGLTTFREFVNWLEVEIGKKSMDKLLGKP
jgi:hypothetical protein